MAPAAQDSAWKPANPARVHAQMIFSQTLIATSFPVGAAITHGLDPALLTLLRFALAAALFAPVVYLRHGLTLPRPGALAGYATISFCLVAFFWCMFEALRTTTALNTGALITLAPGISAVFAAFLIHERLGAHRLVAVGCGLVGALWVVFRGDLDLLLSLTLNRGDLIFFAGCIMFGLYGPLVKRLHRLEPAAVMTLWVLIIGTGWLVLLNGPAIWRNDWSGVDATVFAGIAYLAVFTTIITFFIAQHGTLHIGPTRASSYIYLIPALVVIIEFLAGKGLPSPAVLPGILIIFVATFVVQRGARSEAAPARPDP